MSIKLEIDGKEVTHDEMMEIMGDTKEHTVKVTPVSEVWKPIIIDEAEVIKSWIRVYG